MSVIVTLCPECDDAIDEPGPPLYACGECGEFVGDDGNRCPQCNKFAAKEADATCPSCEAGIDPEELVEVERFTASDGTYHETQAEADQWDDDEPERAAASERHRAEMAADMDRYRAEREARRIELSAALDACPVAFEYYGDDRRPHTIDSHMAMVTPIEFCELLGVDHEVHPAEDRYDRDRVTSFDIEAMRERLVAAGVDWCEALHDDPRRFPLYARSRLDCLAFGLDVATELLPLIAAKVAADA